MTFWLFTKRFFHLLGQDGTTGRYSIQIGKSSPVAEAYKQRLLNQLQDDFSKSQFLIIKDPRICRFVPIWLEVLGRFGADPHIVMPLRNPIEVAASLKARDGFLASKSYLLWLRHVLDAEHDTRNLPRAIVKYDSFVDDWRHAVVNISARTRLHWPRRSVEAELEIDQFIAGELRHHVADPKQLDARADIVDWVKRVYHILSQMADGCETKVQYNSLDKISRRLQQSSQSIRIGSRRRTWPLDRAEQERDRLSNDLDKAQARVAQNEREVTRLSIELKAVRKEVEERNDEVLRIKNDLEAARKFLRDSQTETQHLAGELEQARISSNQTEQERDRVAAVLAQAQVAVTQFELEVATLSGSLQAARVEIDLRERKIDELSSELRSAKTTSAQVDADLVRLKSELIESRKAISDREAKVAKLEHDLSFTRTDSRRRARHNHAVKTSLGLGAAARGIWARE